MKKKSFLKFILWFTLLSTLGVGGGIFFLLFAVVPIEEWYVTRGWSQFKIDQVMKYYVFGWVIFGFAVSFIYYFLVVKKEHWKSSVILCISSVVLCIVALSYFLNTDSSVVQASQGEVEVGSRFTFGPYPELNDLERLKEEGYDGVIALLSDTLPIEKPLIDKLQKEGAEIGIEIISMPMLPWVGDNTETLNNIKALVEKDDKKYYIHCYLGRHRVDVVKQLVSKYSGEDIDLLVLQSTSFERGNVFYDSQNEVIFGPYPTDEEWFTRIRRGEVQEIVSLLRQGSATSYSEDEIKIAKELNVKYTNIPLEENYTIDDLKRIVQYIQNNEQKLFVHKFSMDSSMEELLTLYRYGKTIFPLREVNKVEPESKSIAAKYIVGPPLTDSKKLQLEQLGVEKVIQIKTTEKKVVYKELNNLIDSNQLLYIEVDAENIESTYEMLYHLYFGFENYHAAELTLFTGKNIEVLTRNLSVGPLMKDKDVEQMIVGNGIHKVFYIDYLDLNESVNVEELEKFYLQLGIDFEVVQYEMDFEHILIPKLNSEQHSMYIMVKDKLLDEIKFLLEKY